MAIFSNSWVQIYFVLWVPHPHTFSFFPCFFVSVFTYVHLRFVLTIHVFFFYLIPYFLIVSLFHNILFLSFFLEFVPFFLIALCVLVCLSREHYAVLASRCPSMQAAPEVLTLYLDPGCVQCTGQQSICV